MGLDRRRRQPALKALGDVGEVVVTIHAAQPSNRDEQSVLRFERLALHAYAA